MFLHHEEQSSQAATYPDHIVNGDFEYYTQQLQAVDTNSFGYVLISPLQKYYYSNRWPIDANNQNAAFRPLPSGWTLDGFGWVSTQTHTFTRRNNAVEIQSDRNTQGKVVNHHAELVEAQANTAIYQDISTTPGSVYKWSLKHVSQQTYHLDTMSVMIGTPSSQVAQNATRTTSNGTGKIGEVSTVIATYALHPSNQHIDDWETYEGTYVIPAGQTVTRFTFKSLEGINSGSGNEIDDVTFVIADPLRYDLNGGTGNLPTPQASGTYPGYYQRGTSVTLSDIIPTRSGYTFLGWSKQKHADIANTAIPANVAFIKQKQIEAGDNYVYAIWAKNPTITFKDSITGNTVSTVQLPYNTSVVASDIPSVPDHAGYRFTGYSTAPTSKFIQDTEIELQYEQAGRIQVNVEWIDRDNLAGSREDLQLSIPQAADPSASHDITISKDADTITIPYLPSVNDPKEEIALSAESKYDLTSVSISKITDTNGITTVTYNISVKYIPTSDLTITKIWNDDNDRYKERPSSITVEIYCDDTELPVDANKESPEDDRWRLYDTIVVTGDPAVSDSDSWTAVVHDAPLWSSREHSDDVLVDTHYKIKELPVQGYDLISCEGSVQDGFRIENRVFGHVSVPSTGSSSHVFVIVLMLVTTSVAAVFTLISVLQSRKSIRIL